MRAYDFVVTGSDGTPVTLTQFEGRVLLVVNTASHCGYTPQFAGLEALWQKYREAGLTVLGFPCNQFGFQDPGSDAEILDFCQVNYGVTFPMMAKVDVNGRGAAPLFSWLTERAPGLLGTHRIKWNFTKFLVARDGCTVTRFRPADDPESLTEAIESALGVSVQRA